MHVYTKDTFQHSPTMQLAITHDFSVTIATEGCNRSWPNAWSTKKIYFIINLCHELSVTYIKYACFHSLMNIHKNVVTHKFSSSSSASIRHKNCCYGTHLFHGFSRLLPDSTHHQTELMRSAFYHYACVIYLSAYIFSYFIL